MSFYSHLIFPKWKRSFILAAMICLLFTVVFVRLVHSSCEEHVKNRLRTHALCVIMDPLLLYDDIQTLFRTLSKHQIRRLSLVNTSSTTSIRRSWVITSHIWEELCCLWMFVVVNHFHNKAVLICSSWKPFFTYFHRVYDSN